MKLSDIRCEMCPKWNFLGAARGWCNQHWAVRHKSNMCDIHPLWQQALAEEEEKVSSRCPKHPRYQAKRKPTSDCEHCAAIWKRKETPADAGKKQGGAE